MYSAGTILHSDVTLTECIGFYKFLHQVTFSQEWFAESKACQLK